MLESGFGGVTALLGDLQASSVAVDSVSRCTLLAAALLEGDLQRLLVLSLWLPLLSPHGEALLDALGPSLTFARAPGGSSFGEVWCFDWRGAETHPALTAWLRHRATFDERFDGKGGAAGHAKFKCPSCGQQVRPRRVASNRSALSRPSRPGISRVVTSSSLRGSR